MRVFGLLLLVACERVEDTNELERLDRPPGPKPELVTPIPWPRPPPPPPPPPLPDGAVTLPPDELEEIDAILTGNGTVDASRLADPNLGPDPRWDHRRAWLMDYRKVGQTITLQGEASSISDVTQFARRLTVDPMFTDVTIVTGERVGQIYRFELRLRSPDADPNAPEVRRSFRRP